MIYGQLDDESVITEYLDSHLEEGIKQKNLDKILDLIDEYVELKEQEWNRMIINLVNERNVLITIIKFVHIDLSVIIVRR